MKRPRRRSTSGDDADGVPPEAGSDRAVSDEEATIWALATQSLEPLRRGKPRIAKTTAAMPAVPSGSQDAPGRPAAERSGAVAPKDARPTKFNPTAPREPSAAKPLAAKQPSNARQPPLADFERRVVRKVTTGQIEIDARLDLHGLTQSAAHRRLRSFLWSAHTEGCRIVLVITGKGRDAESEPPTFAEHMEQRERGVLRRSVPIWLEDPDMRAIVVSYTTAGPGHGGSGALYVRLRRRQA